MNELLPCIADTKSLGRCPRCGYHRQHAGREGLTYRYARCDPEPPFPYLDRDLWRRLGTVGEPGCMVPRELL